MKTAPLSPIKTIRAKRNSESGAAAVEFALVLPLFLLIVFGVFDYCWMFYKSSCLANAVQTGVRQGVLVAMTDSPDPATKAVQIAQTNLANNGIGLGNVTLAASYAGIPPYRTLSLNGTMTHLGLFGFVPMPDHVTSVTTMMIEPQ